MAYCYACGGHVCLINKHYLFIYLLLLLFSWVFWKSKNRPNLTRQAFNNLTPPKSSFIGREAQPAALSPALHYTGFGL